MSDFQKLIQERGSGIMVSLTADDLQDLLDSAIDRAKNELLPPLIASSHEQLLTKKEVMKKFGVCDTTLWHWRNKGYLEAVKVGRSVRYRQSDVERVMKQRY